VLSSCVLRSHMLRRDGKTGTGLANGGRCDRIQISPSTIILNVLVLALKKTYALLLRHPTPTTVQFQKPEEYSKTLN
jgi:hypothetical protein